MLFFLRSLCSFLFFFFFFLFSPFLPPSCTFWKAGRIYHPSVKHFSSILKLCPFWKPAGQQGFFLKRT
jgi:hypothetical protein